MQERKPRSPALVKEAAALATGCPLSRGPQARPPPLPTRSGRPSREPHHPHRPQGGTLGPPPTEPCALCVSSGERPCPTAPLAVTTAEAGPPRAMSLASAQQEQRAACSPTHRGPASQEPLGPGPAPGVRGSVHAAGGPNPGPAPGSAAEGPTLSPPEQACQIRHLGPTHTKISSWAPCAFCAHLAMMPAG